MAHPTKSLPNATTPLHRPSRYQAPLLSSQDIAQVPGSLASVSNQEPNSDNVKVNAEQSLMIPNIPLLITPTSMEMAQLGPQAGEYAGAQQQKIWIWGLYTFLCIFCCLPAIFIITLVLVVYFTNAI
ncbi:unnamed protein product [Orchesella dallaii]|uniref:Transmembrane protein n=1 Tax=Orchesella dallaii TaxID=48710 RepID=A0ABP1QLS4_9HEXA